MRKEEVIEEVCEDVCFEFDGEAYLLCLKKCEEAIRSDEGTSDIC